MRTYQTSQNVQRSEQNGAYALDSNAEESVVDYPRSVRTSTTSLSQPFCCKPLALVTTMRLDENVLHEQDKLNRAVRAIETIEGQAWNSEAVRPNETAKKWARYILDLAHSVGLVPEAVIPSAEGGIGFVFGLGRHYADIECFNDGEIVALCSNGQGTIKSWDVDRNDLRVRESINKVNTHIRG